LGETWRKNIDPTVPQVSAAFGGDNLGSHTLDAYQLDAPLIAPVGGAALQALRRSTQKPPRSRELLITTVIRSVAKRAPYLV
jgi:hypothetical protein